VKLVVAAVLLIGATVAAKVGVDRLAPEPAASAGASLTNTDPARPNPTKAGTVEAVRFTGPDVRAPYLADVIVTREGTPFRAQEIEDDRLRIVDALIARGHYDAKVGPASVTWTDGGAWVEFPIDAGSVYVIRSVRVDGAATRKNPGLAQVPTVQAGDDARAEDVEGSADLLRDWLAARHIRATVKLVTQLEPYGKQVDLRYVVE